MPARGDIDPTDIADLLKNIYLAEVEGDPPRFRYRVAGTELEAAVGRRLTGRYVDDGILGGLTDVAHADMLNIVREPQMIYRTGALLISDEPLFNYVRLALPLGNGGRVQIILGAIFYTWISDRSRSLEEAQNEFVRTPGQLPRHWVGEVVSAPL